MFKLKNHLSQIIKSTIVTATGLGGVLMNSSLLGSVSAKSTNQPSQKTGISFPENTEQLRLLSAHDQTNLNSLQTSDSFIQSSLLDFSLADALTQHIEVTEMGKNLELDYRTQQIEPLKTTYPTGEFRVNTYTTNDQDYPAVASLADGGFVVVWERYGGDGSYEAIYGQRYDSSGSPVGSEFQINTYTYGNQIYPDVAGLDGGGFVVVWTSEASDTSSNGIAARLYNESGDPVGVEFQVNTYTNDRQFTPAVSGLDAGGFVVVWESAGQDGDGYEIYGQKYDSDGVVYGSEFRVNTCIIKDQQRPSVRGLNNGGFVVVWQSEEQETNVTDGIYGQLYDDTGDPVGGEFHVNTYINYDQRYPVVAALNSGEFVVIWQSTLQDGQNYGIYGQRYGATGTKLGGEFRVNTYTLLAQQYADVSALNEGGFVVVWSSNGQDGSGYGIYGQRYNATADSYGDEFQVNTYTSTDQLYPSVSSLKNGGFVVVWESVGQDGSDSGIYGRFSGPSIGNNTLTIGKGETAIISISDLSAIDIDSLDNELAFTISNVQYGQFEEGNNPGVAITQFSEAQIKNGDIQFVHDGGELAPSYDVQVSDGAMESEIESATILFAPPILENNTLTIYTDGTVLITSFILSATDTNNTDEELNFTISSIEHGQFEEVSSPGVSITQFTQAQIKNSEIQFVHDGGVVAPAYDVKVSDGSIESEIESATIRFNPPSIENNNLTIDEGETVLITSDMLTATDPDNSDDELTFIISSIEHGQFEIVSNPGVEITQFTQAQVKNDEVQFVHDGEDIAPSYEVKVSDGASETNVESAAITFNDIPSIEHNNLVISEGGTVTITEAMLSAFDTNNPDEELTFIISNIEHGRFEEVSNSGVAIAQFTQAQIKNGEIQFVHDGGEIGPSYDFKVSDGSLESGEVSSNVTFTNINDAPLVSNKIPKQKAEISDAYSYIFASNIFTDAENDPLTYSSTQTNGQDLPAWLNFDEEKRKFFGTPTDGDAGKIKVKVIADDGHGGVASTEFELDVEENSDAGSNLAMNLSMSVGGALVSGIIGYGFWKRKRNREAAFTRGRYPFADMIRKHLKMSNVDNFDTVQGRAYVELIEGKVNEEDGQFIEMGLVPSLKAQGIVVNEMEFEDMNELAQVVAKTIRTEISEEKTRCTGKSKVETGDIANNLARIVKAIVVRKKLDEEINPLSDELNPEDIEMAPLEEQLEAGM